MFTPQKLPWSEKVSFWSKILKPNVLRASVSAFFYSVLSYLIVGLCAGIWFAISTKNEQELYLGFWVGLTAMIVAAIVTLIIGMPVFFLLRKFCTLNYFNVVFAGYFAAFPIMVIIIWSENLGFDLLYRASISSLFGAWSALIFYFAWNKALQRELKAQAQRN